jgi:hypothetical protein
MNVEQVLSEFGHFLRPMSHAPRNGQRIFGVSERQGLVVCYWDTSPSKFAGATWIDQRDTERGYIDRYFRGWLDPGKYSPLEHAALARLIKVYLHELRAKQNEGP